MKRITLFSPVVLLLLVLVFGCVSTETPEPVEEVMEVKEEAVTVTEEVKEEAAGVTWLRYDCDVLPDQNDPAFGESNKKGDIAPEQNILDDGGNKILEFIATGTDDNKFCWKMNMDFDPAKGATVVFRTKAIDQAVYTNSLDIEFRIGTTRDRLIGSGDVLKLDKAKQNAEQDLSGWHTYRLTLAADGANLITNIYVDESDNPLLSGTSESESSDYFFR